LGHLAPGMLTTVLSGQDAGNRATQLVIGVGTGMNAAPVFDTPSGRIVPPAETGHVSLPMHSERDFSLGRFVEHEHGFASVEEVLSGRGLELVYRWLGHEVGDPRRLSSSEIMAALQSGSDPRAAEAVGVFVRCLGTVAGNLALAMLPFGGIYLIGGMVRAMVPFMGAFGFGDAFRAKGRFSGFMDAFPIYVVEDDFAALTGCAAYLAGHD
jgi:glucokinase